MDDATTDATTNATADAATDATSDDGRGSGPTAADDSRGSGSTAADGTATPLLRLTGVSHTYSGQRRKSAVLSGISHSFERGTFYTILGPSGSGKTTLLSLASGLDTPTKGTISFEGRDLRELGLGRYRNRHAATVFQSYNLLTYMTALQNVTAAMEITGVKPASGSRRARALELLERIGLDKATATRNVLRLSGGQQQRVAIARALACDVDILFADEPTGNLDEDTAQGIIDTFRELAHEQGKCVVVVTHSQQLAAQSDRILVLRKGKLSQQAKTR
ncbi:ABC transporter ATP-binding protein [Catenulispora pinisilvae]|uniref:ABC transporter ATP-binding protein n=1 Tax=Catenulispora pinisilvae TaxID=2705253 RepID=UPI00189254CB|nr:ABC transporter ATP-binding protein [Catenulispora pinisilvae]